MEKNMAYALIHPNLEKGFKWCEGWSKPGIQSSEVKAMAEKENSHYLMSYLKSALSI